MTPKILLTGATGFIGGQLLHDLLALKKYDDVTAIVRDSTRAEHLKSKTGVKVIVADLDSPNLADIASEFDVILHTAHADHVEGAHALVAGLEKRAATVSRKPILIHTSGTGVLIRPDEANGKFKSEEVFSDGDLSTYHSLPSTQIHKNVDDIILGAGRRGKIDAIVVCPPTIWGTGEGEFNTHSIQVPLLIRACVEFKHGMILEDGANTWSIIHVADLSQAYLTILEAALNGKLSSDPNGRYFFVENGEYAQKEVTTTATKLLYEKGKVDSSEPKRISVEDAPKFAAGRRNVVRMTGGNSRSRAVLLRKLGWEAKKGGNKEFIASINDEIDYVLSTLE